MNKLINYLINYKNKEHKTRPKQFNSQINEWVCLNEQKHHENRLGNNLMNEPINEFIYK